MVLPSAIRGPRGMLMILQAVAVPQSIHGVVGGCHARRNACNHHSPRWTPGHEGIAEDQSQLRRAEGDMGLVVSAHCPDTFLQRQQRLVDLRTLYTSLPDVGFRVRRPFRAGQVHERELRTDLAAACHPQGDGADGVRARRIPVAGCGVRGPHRVAQINALQHRVWGVHTTLSETRNLHLVPGILKRLQPLPIVKQVKGSSTVDLEEGQGHLQLLLIAPHAN
mmetsp:Transcript_83215/g.184895  ORF Transcript_83215/g.184895 Transcript_83215/m.184895 type:complete len:222 (+) Transcript_83215:195-860(+)